MKTRNVVLALVVLAFVGSLRSFGLTYEFFDNNTNNYFSYQLNFTCYVDGEARYIGINSYDAYKMYWEIDPVQMKTRYAGLSSVRDTPITVNSKWTSGHYEGGFGGAGWVIDWECPYTITLSNPVFFDNTQIGDFAVTPSLGFTLNDANYGFSDLYQGGNANFSSNVHLEFDNIECDFDLESVDFPVDYFGYSGLNSFYGSFGDEGYPDNLSLTMNDFLIWWDGSVPMNQKCYDSIVDGHDIEIYFTGASGGFSTIWYNTWDGTLVPEPTTLSLLCLGLLAIRKRKVSTKQI